MDNNMDEAKVRQVRADLKDLLERVELDIDAFKKQDEKGGEELENTLSNITFNPDVDGYREKLEEKIEEVFGQARGMLKEKGKSELKAYMNFIGIKTAGDFEKLYSKFRNDEYKADDALIPFRDLEKVYGKKGALRGINTSKWDPEKKEGNEYSFKWIYKKIKVEYKKIRGGYTASGKEPSERYIEEYNNFIELSSGYAIKYLKKFDKKFVKLKKIDNDDNQEISLTEMGDYAYSLCKMAFMCLVAASSKSDSVNMQDIDSKKTRVMRMYRKVMK